MPGGGSFWALVSMSAILGGTMRSPFTGVVFAIELTHDFNMLLPLLVANTLSYTISVLFMKRSILTEKLARLLLGLQSLAQNVLINHAIRDKDIAEAT